MQPRENVAMRSVHMRCRNGITHALHNGRGACGQRSVPGCTITTNDLVDSRGLESDTSIAT